jgi:hypothetical protein
MPCNSMRAEYPFWQRSVGQVIGQGFGSDGRQILHLMGRNQPLHYQSRRYCSVCGAVLVNCTGRMPASEPLWTHNPAGYWHPPEGQVTCLELASLNLMGFPLGEESASPP